MGDLFASLENAQAGWRLSRLEILNWGTFDGAIWRLSPQGMTSLLTGDNGSGKSTVVDAILTLLVPSAKRSYNLASGNEKKKERDETSYVLGAFGQERDESTNRSRVKTHRERATARSVLLAVFENDALKASATLAQTFWFDGDTLKKLFFVGELPLSIQDHFLGTANPAELKKRLRSYGQVCDTFRDYQGRFERLFGLRSEKALTLFNQTVSLKSIGSLTSFVREHMLDAGEAEEALGRLRESHEDLSRSHEAILVARRQREILDPLSNRATELANSDAQRAEDALTESVLPQWMAQTKSRLLTTEQEHLEISRESLHTRLVPVERDLEDRRASLAGVEGDIAGNATGRRLQELEQDGKRLAEQGREIRSRRERLVEVLQPLGLALPQSDADRLEILRSSSRELLNLDAQRADKTQTRDATVLELGQRDQNLSNLRVELDSLRSRQSQIPEIQIRMRHELALAMKVADDELPYVGELLRVRESESSWEPAIERLLHGFALRMLVPSRLYREVRDHVENTHLKGRLVFHRAEKPRTDPRVPASETVAGKLDIRPGTPHKAWLATFLAERYDHVCCQHLDEVPASAYALTKNGLVRGGESLHEKDDRHLLSDRSRWVLGWTNEEKIRWIAGEMAEENDQASRLRETLARLDTDLAAIRREETLRDRLPDLLLSWEALDLAAVEGRIALNREEASRLAAESDALAGLQEQRSRLRREVDELDRQRNRLFQEEGALENKAQALEAEQVRCRTLLQERGTCPGADLQRLDAEVARRKILPDLAGLEDLGRKLTEWLRKRQQDRAGEIARSRDAIQGAMGEYLKRFPADSANLGSTLDYLESFLALHQRVVHDDLPRHEARFRELLRTSVVREVSLFRNQLEREEREIRSTLSTLNASLSRIPYTPRTHLQLLASAVPDEEIRVFKADLRDCIGDLSREDETENEARFLRIQKLLKRLNDEERWRRKVIDVRNWLEFSASEIYSDTMEQARHYPDSAGLSGGQKAKLAYTVLASGLAWHFGLEEGEVASRSLRFVVIDEAFSRSDDDSSRFCLELFRKLDLQLLVVTPSDKIHVVEPFIATCHYVWYDREVDRSQVCDLSLSELHDRRAKARRALRGEA